MRAIGPEIPLLAPHQAELMAPVKPAEPDGTVPFADMLKGALDEANQTGLAADKAQAAFASGAVDDIHGTMIALRQADIELHMVSTVRTKVVDAINDLLKMSV